MAIVARTPLVQCGSDVLSKNDDRGLLPIIEFSLAKDPA